MGLSTLTGMRRLTLLTALLAALLSAFALTGTASAGTSAVTTNVYTVSGTSTAAGCAVRLNNGPVGYAICGTDLT